ncbi:dolichyl-diphosphooligosaccharide--protein glycosyltransferase subunit 1 [Ctenocephalides felis]|uniref:dolichyl-diphosphooligosaccharide--protein glycosyltransferase subunit 1 n=1 Tax=Ctenocephalides felis TaxID=7515 RepID=UPI000E6E1CFA|nr:dolichyl-diphosphooligosaccharide--protein glycosyltransferase subunit 1 [Ctenocephalides felis]
MHFLKIFVCVAVQIAFVSAADVINSDIVNKNVERFIDLASQLAKISTKITVENNGKNPISSYLIPIHNEENRYAHIAARDSSKKELKITDTVVSSHEGVSFLRIDFKEPLQPAKTVNIQIDAVFSKVLVPYPSSIIQLERQLVLYHGNHYFYSAYRTIKQQTTVQLASKNIESFSKLKPFSQSDTTITYGSYENIPAFTHDKMTIHYENHTPFLTVTKLERTIEVSHWGNIAVEETIDMVHSGALLKGSFSRYEFQKDSRSGLASVKSYKTMLPASAFGVYYRDTNGNISTSNMRVKKDAVELTLRPRYPLFGGWKTHYTLGYNVPSYEYLFSQGDKYLLKMRAIDHIFDHMIVEEVVTKIILPEGCKDIKLIPPYSVTRLPDSLHYTYLDTKGRPVISFTKHNLVENHIQDFNLHYTFPRFMMLQEPVLIIIFLYVLFLSVIIYVRLDFSIYKTENAHKTEHKD